MPIIITINGQDYCFDNIEEVVDLSNVFDITKINYSYSYISQLSAKFCFLSNLKEFSCNSNYITELPSEIGLLKYLQILYISKNQITYLPSEILSICK